MKNNIIETSKEAESVAESPLIESPLIEAEGLSKQYGKFTALDNLNFTVQPGRIIGLIGANGAGKTTLLRSLLGLSTYEGALQVLGLEPAQDRTQLLEDVSFIADTAVLPEWMSARQLIAYMQGVHPKFNTEKAHYFLNKTKIPLDKRVKSLSKGMVTQLHLALTMAVDAKLLILDEPTLGLDIIYRQAFYEQLLNDYYDEGKTIIITTHQVEEIEEILTDVMFIRDGKLVLDCSVETLQEDFVSVEVTAGCEEQALALNPLQVQSRLGGQKMVFQSLSEAQKAELSELGRCQLPSLADVFVAVTLSSAQSGPDHGDPLREGV